LVEGTDAMSNLLRELNRFYSILGPLEASRRQGLNLASYNGRSGIPSRGVYFFREPGEFRQSDPSTPRIVRVGTHAVSANSKSTLWGRLRAHLGTRVGTGNHRGSIFRLHVGAALLARDNKKVESWGIGSSVPPKVRSDPRAMAAETAWEKRVSDYIGAMSVIWVDVPDDPGPNSIRALIEKNAIALLSNRLEPIESASANWLGHHSPRDEIRRSHLWNLNHVNQAYDPGFLDHLQTAAQKTILSVNAD
jgi:hypothetical protein